MKPQTSQDDPLAFIDELAYVITQIALIAVAVVVAVIVIALL